MRYTVSQREDVRKGCVAVRNPVKLLRNSAKLLAKLPRNCAKLSRNCAWPLRPLSRRPARRTRRATICVTLEPWCVEVSRVSGSVEQCRGSVGAVSVDTGVGCRAVSGCSVGAVSGLLDSGDVRIVSRCQAVSECRSVGVSGCRTGVEVSECRCPTQTASILSQSCKFRFQSCKF